MAYRVFFSILTLLAASFPARAEVTDKDLAKIKLPPGFKIEVFAAAEGARSLSVADDGSVFIGSGGASGKVNRVYHAKDRNGDGKADVTDVFAEGLQSPNGVAFFKGDLYVAEIERIRKYPRALAVHKKKPDPVVIYDKFPKDRHHGWKYIAFGPDDKLYAPVGAPCNICDTDEKPATRGRYMRLFRMNPDGSQFEEYAAGIRNTVGFDWHPKTKELWFTDNGRDMMGNDVPPDELNRAPQKGMHFGYPFVHGKAIQDPEFGRKKPQGLKVTPPEVELGAHVAALGMTFYTGKQFPKDYADRIFIAEHGSWNRDPVQGYRVTMVYAGKDGKYRYEPFAEGWLEADQKRWGRPVDVKVARDGALLVSDDLAGVVYRISYTGATKSGRR